MEAKFIIRFIGNKSSCVQKMTILRGLYHILNFYSESIDLFYNSSSEYIKKLLEKHCGTINLDSREISKEKLKDVQICLQKCLIDLGFSKNEINRKLSLNIIDSLDFKNTSNNFQQNLLKNLVKITIEIFLEKIVYYLVDNNGSALILSNLKERGFLPIEFLLELNNLKNMYNNSIEKTRILHKYMLLRRKVIEKLLDYKDSIERLEFLNDVEDRVQLFYLLHKIIDFFNINHLFDFSKMKEYLSDQAMWLDTVPLVSLKNPDLYYCGVYLSKILSIDMDEDYAKYYLVDLFDEFIEFECPIIQAPVQLYYYLKTSRMLDLEFSDDQVREFIKGSDEYFDETTLKNLETSHLVLVLLNYKMLGLYNKIENNKTINIMEEIDRRITPDGILQYRDGIVTSEAIYHVLLFNIMKDSMVKLQEHEFIDKIILRIYRNLELISFSDEINFDLISELDFSLETLKIINCIDDGCFLSQIGNYLFPNEVIDKMNIVGDRKVMLNTYIGSEQINMDDTDTLIRLPIK